MTVQMADNASRPSTQGSTNTLSPVPGETIPSSAAKPSFLDEVHDTTTNKGKVIQGTFSGLDFFSLYVGSLKSGFDYGNGNQYSSGNQMHDWLESPEGLATFIIGSIGFAAFGVATNVTKDVTNDEEKKQKYSTHQILFNRAIRYSPYFRDVLKIARWTQRSQRTVGDVFKNFVGKSVLDADILMQFNNVILPTSIVFGVLGIGSRIYNRRLKKKRQTWQEKHTSMALDLRQRWGKDDLTYEDCQKYLGYSTVALKDIPEDDQKYKIYSQPEGFRMWGKRLSYIPSILAGTFDGMYAFLGVLTLTAALNPYLYLSLVILSISYIVASIVVRCFEERTYQDKLERTQKEVESVLYGRQAALKMDEFNTYWDDICILRTRPGNDFINRDPDEADDAYKNRILTQVERWTNDELLGFGRGGNFSIKRLPGEIDNAYIYRLRVRIADLLSNEYAESLQKETTEAAERFEEPRKKLSELNETTYKYKTAVLAGIRAGIAFYAPVINIMFTVSIISTIASFAFPPWLLVAGVFAGLACIISFVIRSLYAHRKLLDRKNGCKLYELTELPEETQLYKYRNSYILVNDRSLYYVHGMADKHKVTIGDLSRLKQHLEISVKCKDKDSNEYMPLHLTATQINNWIGHERDVPEYTFFQELTNNIDKVKDSKLAAAERLRLEKQLEADLQLEVESPGIDLQLVAEVLRQVGTANNKTERAGELVANSEQVKGVDGKYHAPDTPLMWVITSMAAAFHMVIYGLKNAGKAAKKEDPPAQDLGPIATQNHPGEDSDQRSPTSKNARNTFFGSQQATTPNTLVGLGFPHAIGDNNKTFPHLGGSAAAMLVPAAEEATEKEDDADDGRRHFSPRC